jgi:hypothetical protein
LLNFFPRVQGCSADSVLTLTVHGKFFPKDARQVMPKASHLTLRMPACVLTSVIGRADVG